MTAKKHKKLLIAFGLLLVLIACGAALLPLVARSTNCGGNSAALAACKSAAICFRLIASERDGKPVSVADLSEAERDYFKQIAGLNWLGEAKVLVAAIPVSLDSQKQQIVAACDRAFDNVPRRVFGKSPLTHAVAYTDGSTALISVEDYQKLDVSKFVDVKSFQPTNSHQSVASSAPGN
jgi:hypothetical protein